MTKHQQQFMEDMVTNGIDVQSIENQYGERGPAVQCSRMDAKDVQACTTVKCCTDRAGEGDVLIYPMEPGSYNEDGSEWVARDGSSLANARLIAAAPKLLEAAQARRLFDQFAPNPFGHDCQWCSNCVLRMQQLGTAAIAKALDMPE